MARKNALEQPEIQWYEPSELEEALDALPDSDESVIWLYRIDAQGENAFIEKYQPAKQFDISNVKKQYGGGKYRVLAKSGNKIKENRFFKIDGPPVLQLTPAPGSPAMSTPSGSVDPLLAAINGLRDDIKGRSQQAEFASTIRDLLTKKNPTEEEILEKMIKYKSLFGGGGGGGDVVGAIKAAVEMVGTIRELAPEAGEGGSPWLSVLKDFKDPAIKLLGRLVELMERGAPAKPLTDGGRVLAHNKDEKAPVSEPEWMAAARPYLPILMGAAARNSNPELYVDLVLDNLPPAVLPSFKTWLLGEAWLKELDTLAPGVILQAGWWAELHDLLLQDEDLKNVNPASEAGQPPGSSQAPPPNTVSESKG